jgi:imidazolonepropionase-like amidohydrolase
MKYWRSLYPKFQDNFRRMTELGVPMVCGSDCGWGYSTFRESYLEVDAMATAGAPVTEALFAATGRAADSLGLSDLTGRLKAGLKADLLVVEGDATSDTKALANVREVWREGEPMLGKSPFGPLKW